MGTRTLIRKATFFFPQIYPYRFSPLLGVHFVSPLLFSHPHHPFPHQVFYFIENTGATLRSFLLSFVRSFFRACVHACVRRRRTSREILIATYGHFTSEIEGGHLDPSRKDDSNGVLSSWLPNDFFLLLFLLLLPLLTSPHLSSSLLTSPHLTSSIILGLPHGTRLNSKLSFNGLFLWTPNRLKLQSWTG